MTEAEYKALSYHLPKIVSNIPIRWGKIQNDNTDSKINMFHYNSYQELDLAIQGLKKDTKDYFKKRWFLWKCAQCDEYLFYRHDDVNRNPNFKDQDWDFEFFGMNELRFDLKGTIIPRKIKDKMQGKYPDAMEVIAFNYKQQSTGIRNNMQNRLFVIHKPHNWRNENHLRANFEAKKSIYDEYLNLLRQNPKHKFLNYLGQKTDIIYLYEKPNGKIKHSFASLQ